MTDQEFIELLQGCNFRQPDQVSELVTSTVTQVAFQNQVAQKTVSNPLGAYNYFGGLFGTQTWPDGIGMDMVREYYAHPHLPFSFSYFVRQTEICDPNLADECRRDRCDIPEGGRGTMPPPQFFKTGFKTPRDCIANIRHIRNFRWWAERTVDGMALIDEQIMNIFYTMVGIKTAGHKIVLQAFTDTDGINKLVPSNNPRNPMRYGLYNYMEDKFPQLLDLEKIAPIELDYLKNMVRYWDQNPNGAKIATGPRGESIYEIWAPDDLYEQFVLTNPDYIEKVRRFMPNSEFPGWTMKPGEREIVENYAFKVMPWLPRFAPTSDGRIIPVDTKVGVDIEVGKEWLPSVDFENAPFGIAVIASGKQGTILKRPPLTTSGAGFPIEPITGDGPWKIRNDYDKDCNPERNMPYAVKDYEMGFIPENPDAGTAILFRRKVFNMAPINFCDTAPIFVAADPEINCPITTVGCQNGKVREDNSIVGQTKVKHVNCTAVSCGNSGESPYTYIVKIDRRANEPGFNSLGCECGSAVNLYIYDENGAYSRQIQGIYTDNAMSFPDARYFVETTSALLEGECIRGIACADETPLQGNVVTSWDIAEGLNAGDIGVILDDSIVCGEEDDVQIRFYNAAGAVLGTVNAIIEEMDINRFFYRLSSSTPDFSVDMYPGTASIGVSCNEAPNTSSSSSSSGD